MTTPPSFELLRSLVNGSPVSILQLAKDAGVPYQPLQRFAKGVNPRYNLWSAELVYMKLTGKNFIEESRLPGRRKGGAK